MLTTLLTQQSSGITANLSATLADVVLSSSGTISVPSITAELSATLEGVTLSSSATVAFASITGDLSATLEGVLLSATGTVSSVAITGNLSETLENVSLSSSGTITQPAITADLHVTLGDVTLVSVAGIPLSGGGGPSAKRGWAREREILEQSLKEVSVKSIANTMANAGQQPATKIAKKLEDYSGEIEQIEALKKELSRLESVKLKKKLDEDKRADIQRAADDLQRILKDDEDVFYAMSAVEELEKQIILSIFRLH